MLQYVVMSLVLSYLSFDVPTKETVWLLREDQSGLYSIATPIAGDDRQITVSVDDGCDCEKDVQMAEAFEIAEGDFNIIEADEDGERLIYSTLIGTDQMPHLLIQSPNGTFYYLKNKQE